MGVGEHNTVGVEDVSTSLKGLISFDFCFFRRGKMGLPTMYKLSGTWVLLERELLLPWWMKG